MSGWLHLVRDGRDEWVEGLIRRQAAAGATPAVVLLAGAAEFPKPLPAGVPVARHGPGGTLDDAGLVRRMAGCARLAVW